MSFLANALLSIQLEGIVFLANKRAHPEHCVYIDSQLEKSLLLPIEMSFFSLSHGRNNERRFVVVVVVFNLIDQESINSLIVKR